MLYKLQEKILNKSKENYLFHLGTGTGKTIIALHHYIKYSYPLDLIIIAPAVKVKEGGWDREIKFVFNELGLEMPKYEVVSYSKLKKYVAKKGHYIFDECHYIKNSTSLRGKISKELVKKYATCFSLLSATPASKWEEWCNYFILWGICKNKTEFYKRYVVMGRQRYGSIEFNTVVGYQNTELLKEHIKRRTSKKYTVNDMVEMPDLIEQYIEFKCSSEYKKIKNDRIMESNGSIIKLDTISKLYSTLRQQANITDKLEYLEYIINSNEEDNVLIFYNFNYEKDMIINYLKSKKIKVDYIINGVTKNYPIKENFELINNTVTLVQIQAGGTGIELTYINKVVYFSPTYSYQDYIQSIGRAYRNGQENKVLVYKFKVLNSIETDIWECLERKEDFNERLYSIT